MAKRYNARALKKHHNYTIEEAAEALGAHPQTVRAWFAKGLPCLNGKSPHLVLGDHLQAFLSANATARKQPLGPDQLYCLRCKAAKIPAGEMADFIADRWGRGTLTGICPDCEGLCNRFAREDQLPVVAPNLAIIRPAGKASLEEPDEAA